MTAKKKEGKIFEADFKDSLKKIGWVAIRLKDDAQNFYGRNRNICDFIAYNHPNLYLLELKSYGTTAIPLEKITQREDLLKYADQKGVVSGVVLNFRRFSKTFFVPIKALDLITDRKSITVEFCEEHGTEILATLKRTHYHYHFDIMGE